MVDWYCGGANGQTGYGSNKLDAIVEKILLWLFDQIKERPQTDLARIQQENMLDELKHRLKWSNDNLVKLEKERTDYKREVINAIRGESRFSPEILNELIAETDRKSNLPRKKYRVFKRSFLTAALWLRS